MVDHKALTVVAILLAVTIAVSSSPFHTGWAVKKDFSLITGRATEDIKQVDPREKSWWLKFFEPEVPEPEDIVIPEDPIPEFDIPSGDELQENAGYEDPGLDGYDVSADTATCATTVDERINQLNDRIAALENQQTTSACSGPKTDCKVTVIDTEIMVLPGETFTCHDSCKINRAGSCQFAMSMTQDENGVVTWVQLDQCETERERDMTPEYNGKSYEIKKFCNCCR